MANPTIADFRARFPELSTVSDTLVNAFLYDVENVWLEEDLWDERDYPLAVLYLTAHLLSIFQIQSTSSGSPTGMPADTFVNSISIEGRTISFAQRGGSGAANMTGAGEELLGTTLYGSLFLQLRARNIVPVVVV
jgi:Protein of unknown function (DUF4054)